MAGRKTKPEVNRRGFHARRVEEARTPKSRLWALLHWLLAEAWNAGQIDRITRLIEDEIESLIAARKEANTNDQRSNGA